MDIRINLDLETVYVYRPESDEFEEFSFSFCEIDDNMTHDERVHSAYVEISRYDMRNN